MEKIMKIFNIDRLKIRIFHALFGWSLIVPFKKEQTKPFEGKITSEESDDEVWADPLIIADDSILRRTDPLLMTRSERRNNTIRYLMEIRGYSRKDVEKPLTEQRLRELGYMPHNKFCAFRRRMLVWKYGENSSQVRSFDTPSHLELQEEKNPIM